MTLLFVTRVPDAVQQTVHRRVGTVSNGALCYDPGSANQRYTLHHARDTCDRR